MNILNEIAEKRRIDIEMRKQSLPLEALKERVRACVKSEAFAFPFEQQLQKPGMHFICEVKKASPSKGLIAPDFPYLEIAKAYEQAGACAVSVLTEPEYFLGKDEYLQEIAQTISLPVLRKDFTIDAYQIYEAKLLGASAILLICSLLSQEQLQEFLELAHSIGLSALVETHSEEEIRMAMDSGARIIGVNNRDLKNFTVDIQHSIRLRSLVPEEILFISESGIRTPEDIKRLQTHGVNGVLIGETLMTSTDKKDMLRHLRGEI